MGQGGHRDRQGIEQGAAAGLGVRWPHRRAHAEGSWSPARKAYLPESSLPVYLRQDFPETVLGSGAVAPLASGTELFRNDEVRVWTLDGEVVIASITAKLHLISPTVTDGLLKALEIAEAATRAW